MGRRKSRSTVVISCSAVIIGSTGDAAIGLAVDARGDRMMPMLTLVDDQRRAVKIELTALDVKHLHDDAG